MCYLTELTNKMDQTIGCTNDIQFRNITQDEIRLMHSMETESFPEDEAEDYDIFVYRQREAPDLLLGCYLEGRLVGFICATRYNSKELTKECTRMHIPNGERVYIHSVVVKKEHRRKGIALKMMQVFIDKVKKEQQDVSRILLMCKSDLIPMYKRAGFMLYGRSNIVHGKDPWYEMQLPVPDI